MPGCALAVFGLFGFGVLGDVDQAAFVRTEVAAGIAPRAPGEDPEPTITGELTPGYGIRARNERTSFTLQLTPRLYYRLPNLGDVERPLVLGRASVGKSHRVSDVLTWTSSVNAQYGELEFASTDLALDTPVLQERLDPVVTVSSVEGQTEFQWQVTPTYELELAMLAGYTYLSGDAQQNLPETTVVGGDLVQRWQLDSRSSIAFPLSPRYYFVDPEPDTFSLSLQAVYERLLSTRDTLTAAGGITAAQEEGTDLDAFPRASLALSSVIYQRPGMRVTNEVSAGIDAVFEPTLGELRPVVAVAWSERADLGTSWSVSLNAQASTSATSDPLGQGSAGAGQTLTIQGETNLSGSLLAAYRAADWLRWDFGVRASTQGSHLDAEDFEFIDEQVWVFTGLTLLFGLGSRETPDWFR